MCPRPRMTSSDELSEPPVTQRSRLDELATNENGPESVTFFSVHDIDEPGASDV